MLRQLAPSMVRAIEFVGALVLLVISTNTGAMSASPWWATQGNYTVSWSYATGCQTYYYPYPPPYQIPMGYGCVSLQEKTGGGAWVDVPTSSGSTSWNASGKSQNSYQYQIFSYYCDYAIGCYSSVPEGPVSVTVGPAPPTDPVSTQLTYQFETRVGDINSDGKTDLFVRRTSGGVSGNGVLEQVILRQNGSGGTFTLVAPDGSQSATAVSWPTSSATTVVNDFNVDGFADVEVKGVAAAVGASGAFDQIVFSPAAFYTPQPLGLRAVDESLKKFVANSLDYFYNPNYFEENAIPRYFSGSFVYFYCDYIGMLLGGIVDSYHQTMGPCEFYYVSISGTYTDYTMFNTDALAIWMSEDAFAAGAVAAADSTENAQEATEETVGVEIGGWAMEEELGPTGEHTDPDVRRGLETFWAIIFMGQAFGQEVQTEEAPQQTPRNPDNVWLVGRAVAGLHGLGRHSALEYMSLPPYTTISAFDSDPSALGNGLLISQKNYEPDKPRLMQTITAVVLPAGMTATGYWGTLLASDTNYNDNLPYAFSPTTGVSYNSNGYTHGILNKTGGSITTEALIALPVSYVGWYNPVPSSAFDP